MAFHNTSIGFAKHHAVSPILHCGQARERAPAKSFSRAIERLSVLYVRVSVFLCLCLCGVCACVCMCMHMCLCLSVSVCVCLCVCACACVCVCLCVRVCACVCMSVCVCVLYYCRHCTKLSTHSTYGKLCLYWYKQILTELISASPAIRDYRSARLKVSQPTRCLSNMNVANLRERATLNQDADASRRPGASLNPAYPEDSFLSLSAVTACSPETPS